MHMRHPAYGLGVIAMLFNLFALQVGCDAVTPPDREQLRRQKPASPWHIHDHFTALVKQAESGDIKALVTGLQTYFPERDDFIELFGSTRGESMWVGYRDVIIPRIRTEGAEVMAKRIKAGMTTVDIERVGPIYPGRTTLGDHAMLEAMVARRPMYTIRFRASEESLGFRLNGFVFVRGRWRAFLKSYDFLPEPKPVEKKATPLDPPTVLDAPGIQVPDRSGSSPRAR